MAVIQAKNSPVKDAAVRLEVLRLQLQSKVMAAATGAASLDAKEVEGLVKGMQAAAGKDSKLLTNTLLILAKDLQEQLSQVKNAGDKAKLAGGIQVLLTQLAEVSQDPGMLDWAATTMWQLANGLGNQGGAAAIAKKLNSGAVQVYQKILDAVEKNPNFLEPIQRKPEDIQLKQAMAYRSQGDHQKAADAFAEILKRNTTQLTAQIEAAKNYQEWSTATKDSELLKKAMFGGEPDARQKNRIWGWGNLSTTLSSQIGTREDLRKIFFEARLQLATCRRELAMTLQGDERKRMLEKALGDIRQTYARDPELGSKESKAAFDKLTRSLQTDLAKPTVGLQEFDLAANANAPAAK